MAREVPHFFSFHPEQTMAAYVRAPRRNWPDPLLAEGLRRNHPPTIHSTIERVGRAHGMMGPRAARHQHLTAVKYALASRKGFGGCSGVCCALDSVKHGSRQTQCGLVLGKRDGRQINPGSVASASRLEFPNANAQNKKSLQTFCSGLFKSVPVCCARGLFRENLSDCFLFFCVVFFCLLVDPPRQ